MSLQPATDNPAAHGKFSRRRTKSRALVFLLCLAAGGAGGVEQVALVEVSAGAFEMGSMLGARDRDLHFNEAPARTVRISNPFHMGVTDAGCTVATDDPDANRYFLIADMPAVGTSAIISELMTHPPGNPQARHSQDGD